MASERGAPLGSGLCGSRFYRFPTIQCHSPIAGGRPAQDNAGDMTTARHAARSLFGCGECGYESPKWLGRCPECGSWNSFAETTAARGSKVAPGAAPIELSSLDAREEPRMPVGISEFDRVLGGGLVAGSVVLVGGDPGIGKSTLLLQAAAFTAASGRNVVYLSGEESGRQIKMRAERLGIRGDSLYVLGETELNAALRQAEELCPGLLIVDSIQTVYSDAATQAPGSVAQLRACTMALMRWSKASGVPTFLVGHVTKDGEIAGPRLLEHIVDVVLYLEGERFSSYRLLRGVKNRFGSVDEVGVFEMTGEGIRGVDNPSETFIAERAADGVGSVIVPALEGAGSHHRVRDSRSPAHRERSGLRPASACVRGPQPAAGHIAGRAGCHRLRRGGNPGAGAGSRPRAGAGYRFLLPGQGGAGGHYRPGRGRTLRGVALGPATGAAVGGGGEVGVPAVRAARGERARQTEPLWNRAATGRRLARGDAAGVRLTQSSAADVRAGHSVRGIVVGGEFMTAERTRAGVSATGAGGPPINAVR